VNGQLQTFGQGDANGKLEPNSTDAALSANGCYQHDAASLKPTTALLKTD
jgi:hypothetical protein